MLIPPNISPAKRPQPIVLAGKHGTGKTTLAHKIRALNTGDCLIIDEVKDRGELVRIHTSLDKGLPISTQIIYCTQDINISSCNEFLVFVLSI